MLIEKSIDIARPAESIFDFVSDPRNDPLWCPKVCSVEFAGQEEIGPGARFEVEHKPIPFRPPRRMSHTLVEWTPPREIRWREVEGDDVILVTYTLTRTAPDRTRFTQRDDAHLSAPKALQPFMRIGIGVDIAKQLRVLRSHLEEGRDE